MNLITTMRFMKNPLNFQVLLQQSCLVDGELKAWHPLGNFCSRQQLCNSCNQVVTRVSHPSYNLVTTVAQLLPTTKVA